jgi:hypothetical protein
MEEPVLSKEGATETEALAEGATETEALAEGARVV